MKLDAKTVMLSIVSCLSIVAVAVCLPACSSSPATSSVTWGDLHTGGETEFSTLCALCHGKNGEGGFGPPVIGNNANLWKYYTAQGLLDFISVAMPFNAPGSLTHQQYLNEMGYLLVSNAYVLPGQPFVENGLVNFTLPEPTAPPP